MKMTYPHYHKEKLQKVLSTKTLDIRVLGIGTRDCDSGFYKEGCGKCGEFYWEDDDFKADSWIRALQLLNLGQSGCEEFVVGSTPLSLVKEGDVKVHRVVAIIKSCVPNGFGDLMVTLKDPTGTIDSTIHRKVLPERVCKINISEFCCDTREGFRIFTTFRKNSLPQHNKDKSGKGEPLFQNCY